MFRDNALSFILFYYRSNAIYIKIPTRSFPGIENNNAKFHMETQKPRIVKTTMSNKRKLEGSLSQISNCTTKLHGPGIKTNMMINRVIYI